MPEGDTIYRAASTLRKAVDGALVQRASSTDKGIRAASVVGQRVDRIETRGKHLLLHFDNSLVLHTHLGMKGAWHVYATGQPWRKPAWQAALSLEVNAAVAVCFRPKTLELLTATAFRRHRYLHRLGPDLLDDAFDPQEALRRLRVHDPTPVGEAILNQTVFCGLGNVYKSEVLFLSRINPFTRVATVSDAALIEMLDLSRKLIQQNVSGYRRRTRFAGDGQRLWVYDRSGESCLVCGTTIAMRRQGDLGRSTYWCSNCQSDAEEGAADA